MIPARRTAVRTAAPPPPKSVEHQRRLDGLQVIGEILNRTGPARTGQRAAIAGCRRSASSGVRHGFWLCGGCFQSPGDLSSASISSMSAIGVTPAIGSSRIPRGILEEPIAGVTPIADMLRSTRSTSPLPRKPPKPSPPDERRGKNRGPRGSDPRSASPQDYRQVPETDRHSSGL